MALTCDSLNDQNNSVSQDILFVSLFKLIRIKSSCCKIEATSAPLLSLNLTRWILCYCSADALACGADIVVQSSHKTLTALSQAAMMHLGREAYRFKFPLQSGGRGGEVSKQAEEGVDNRTEEAGELLQDCFSMLTTTSPNLVLLASLDATRAQMASEGEAMIQSAAAAADEIRYELRQQGLLRDEDSEEEEKVMGGVQLLDDSLSVGAARRHKKCNEEICVDSPQWLIDPLRLTVRFPGRSALDVDDGICEGKPDRRRLIEVILFT